MKKLATSKVCHVIKHNGLDCDTQHDNPHKLSV
jgi:hypothetical protein